MTNWVQKHTEKETEPVVVEPVHYAHKVKEYDDDNNNGNPEHMNNDVSILWRQAALISIETEMFISVPVSSEISGTCNGIPSKIIFKDPNKAASLIFNIIKNNGKSFAFLTKNVSFSSNISSRVLSSFNSNLIQILSFSITYSTCPNPFAFENVILFLLTFLSWIAFYSNKI